jgi:hypothetical protein
VFCPCPGKSKKRKGGNTCRSSTSPHNRLSASTRWKSLSHSLSRSTHVYRQHPGSRRQFRSEDAVVEGQALHKLEKAAARHAERSPHHRDAKNTSNSMMQRILNSKNLVAFVLPAATGMTLYFRVLFPEGNIFLRVMALPSPSPFGVLKYSYTLSLFSTPYIGYSVAFSGLCISALRAKHESGLANCPSFPTPSSGIWPTLLTPP